MTLADKLDQPAQFPPGTQEALKRLAETFEQVGLAWRKASNALKTFTRKVGNYFRDLFTRKASPALATIQPRPKSISPSSRTAPGLKLLDFIRFTLQLSPPTFGQKVTFQTATRGLLAD